MLLKVALGLIGLGIVVLIHEIGHFVAAKLSGVTVETFSVGWGRRLVGFTRNDTEYRLSVFPIGGFVRMKGEHALTQAWENNRDRIDPEPGDLFHAKPWRRIVISAAGPAANVVFAVVAYTLVALIGREFQTYDNRIVLESDAPQLSEATEFPATIAGLQTGDRIVSVAGRPTETFRDVQREISVRGGESVSVTYERDGDRLTTTIDVAMSQAGGGGRIGAYPWIDPVVDQPTEEGSAAGFQPGDRLVRVNGTPVSNSIDVRAALLADGERLEAVVRRGDTETTIAAVVAYDPSGARLPLFSFPTISIRERGLPLFTAIGAGFSEMAQTFAMTIRGIGMLFQGLRLTDALSGPLRITYFMGEVATTGISQGARTGFVTVIDFLALLSVAIGFANLLPIPALDGGQILLHLYEGVTRRPLRPKAVYRYQIAGVAAIVGLLAIALVGDITFFVRGPIP